MVAIARESLNVDDGDGIIVDLMVWDQGSRAKRWTIGLSSTLHICLGHLDSLILRGITFDSGVIRAQDVACWPFGVPWLSSRPFFLPCGGPQC